MKWISVKDRLPTRGERVLFKVASFVGEGYVDEYDVWYRMTGYRVDFVLGEVEFWMYMPK